MDLTISILKSLSDIFINLTLTHYIKESKIWHIFNEARSSLILDLMWEYWINHSETIHTLKSTSELNLWQISLKLTASLQNRMPKYTDVWPFLLTVFVDTSNRRSAAVVSFNKIPIWRWHYSGTNSPYNPERSRRVSAYIASRRKFMRDKNYLKWPCYFHQTSLSSRINLESVISRSLKFKHVLLEKHPTDLYQIFKTSSTYVIDALAKYNRNRANLVYSFLCLRKNGHNYWRGV